MKTTPVIRLSGKARQVFRLIQLLALHRGSDTLGKIMEEMKSKYGTH